MYTETNGVRRYQFAVKQSYLFKVEPETVLQLGFAVLATFCQNRERF